METYRIRELRKKHQLSGTEIAAKLGVSAQYYYDIETGRRNLSAAKATQLAEIFNVTSEYLLGISDSPTEKTHTPSIREEKPYYALTSKEERDIEKRLQSMMSDLSSEDTALAFMGEPMEDEDRELLRDALGNALRMAKQLAKKKFTPKKYRR